MKAPMQFAMFMLALGTLLSGMASGKTPVATLPLKASILAQPNVIFAMDDSGSMDWETLLDTQSGVAWWNGSTAWDSVGNKPLARSSLVPYAYLLPVGSATGGAIYDFLSLYGQAAPPINQLAWLRSARFNPAYYESDAKLDYKPWAQAYLGGSVRTYANAPVTSASAHPAVAGAPRLFLGSPWNSSQTNFDTDGWRFYVQAGMVLPVGTRVLSSRADASGMTCTGAAQVDLTAPQTVAPGQACWASIPYFPATFWHPETCTVGNDCVLRPDGAGTLKRYEIRGSNSYPSGRSTAAELQNFANWFSYSRKRKLMLAGAMGQVLETTSGLRMGVVPFNAATVLNMVEADAATPANNRLSTAGIFHLNAMTQAGTPTHATVQKIANEFEANASVVQYACQRNSMFIVTDGFSNTDSSSVPAYDPSKYGATAPYAPTAAGSLADLALAYYTNRLRASDPTLPAGRLPVSASTAPDADKNPDLHINTYALTLGVRGTVWPSSTDPFVVAPVWPTPVGNTPTMVDDLWHATLNGRGQMYLATTPKQTAASIRAGLDDIVSQTGAQGGLAVTTVNLARSDERGYAATYDPAGWAGDLQAIAINTATGGAMSGPALWSAAARLNARPWAERVIATFHGTAGAPFSGAAVEAAVNPGGVWGNSANLMSYLRGARAGEAATFRVRKSLMGAVINAEPAIDRDTEVAYLATGEGMLHAFDIKKGAGAGNELWAYVPGRALTDMGRISARDYLFRPRLDGTPVLRRTETGVRLLVSGMGSAGRGYFALDVSAPRGLNETTLATKALWEFPLASDAVTSAKMGQTLGKPAIVRAPSGNSVVLVTSGYNNTADGKGRLWVLNATTGQVLKEYVTPDGSLTSEAGLAQMSPFAEADGTVRYVYGGDLLGNVWRFDLALNATDAGAVNRVAQLRDAGGGVQPVTAAPELLSSKGKRIVFVGTGRLLDISDFGRVSVQSMYAVADGSTLANARNSLVPRVLDTTGSGSLSGPALDWSTQRGWYLDLPVGEQVNHRPALAYGALAWIGNRTGKSDCSASARLFVVDALLADKFPKSSFVTSLLSGSSNASGLTGVLTRDGQFVRFNTRLFEGGDVDGRSVNAGAVIDPAKNSWREIRR